MQKFKEISYNVVQRWTMEVREKVMIPPYRVPTKEELKRRQQAFAEIQDIKEKMKPLGCSVVDLIREDRDDNGE